MATKTEYKVIGTRPIRHDGYDKVTGKALFGADMNLPGMIFGHMLRSPHAHAKILSIDTSRAEAHPDVLAVVTSKDYPELVSEAKVLNAGPPINLFHMSSNIMARGKVLYKGHAVAAVAANSAHAAQEAVSLIDVEYEVLSSVATVEEAMKPGAEKLHDEYEGNVASHNQVSIGDVEEGFRQADFVVEREFRTKTVHQGYLEPHSATAWWLADGRITIWSSSQGHFPVRDRTAAMLGIASSRIKAIP
ncbi:MAG: xanthine dehydrogenase family protein molybdopterin-binding subunit, partial [Chloroflexi bacterium]|nr:xanthine dehydrogenase family protein molybdopterin-binding subunit [Chloroflexota bacterium]